LALLELIALLTLGHVHVYFTPILLLHLLLHLLRMNLRLHLLVGCHFLKIENQVLVILPPLTFIPKIRLPLPCIAMRLSCP